MNTKTLYDISWQVPEEVYREDPALSYSTLATYKRIGFNELSHLFDRKETPSLTFGSAVDSIITGGQREFDDRFLVADYPDTPDSIIKIVKELFKEFHITHQTLESIPDEEILGRIVVFNYQPNWKADTRIKMVKEKGTDYYNLLHLAEGKTLLTSETYQQVLASVRALKESEATRWYFQDDNPFDDSVKRYYQLKFKSTLNGIDYRCMADLIIVDYTNKKIYPCDLKTSSHKEWDFFKSFVDWDYQIQARLYWRIIKDNCERDDYFKDFEIMPYSFIVVNKESLTPLVWTFPFTSAVGLLTFGGKNNIEFRDPEEIGSELSYYLNSNPIVPSGISLVECNDLVTWLNKL